MDIKFVNLETGNTFNGSSPYIFWMSGEQSINLIYSQPICFISNSKTIDISIEENEIFQLIDPTKLSDSKLENICDFEYHNINSLKTNTLTSIGARHHNYYVHIIYIIASTKQAGEYIVNFKIGDETFQVGGDFYGENENLYINLSNNGVEIPAMIQKAIYDVNIHEEKCDDITLNRKWKELLSNFWDVVANKGSYKSLFNSLNWFEYGDTIRLCEIWKNTDSGNFFCKDIQQVLSDKYTELLNGFSKTTYIALYHALEKHKTVNGQIVLDDEKNPELEYITSKWSTQDLALKLCMLGNFYETYFMPIHMDLIHSTIEDIVYTNTFKVRQGNTSDRSDFVYFCEDIDCNVKNGDIYRLGLVSCNVGPDTLFGAPYKEKDLMIVGVQRTPVDKLNNDNERRQYASQLYNEIGAIIDFEITIPLLNGAKIKRETIVFKALGKSETITNYRILGSKILFSLLCVAEGEYDIRLQFDSTDGKVYTKRVKFNVLDTEHTNINIYKIQNLGSLDGCTVGQQCQINDYIISRRSYEGETVKSLQYIPACIDETNTSPDYKGIRLNHLLIYKFDNFELNLNWIKEHCKYLLDNYFTLTKMIGRNTGYLICISKQYGFNPVVSDNGAIGVPAANIYRKDYIFMPEFHKLVPLVNNGEEFDINSYIVKDEDSLCIIPDLTYGKMIQDCDWEFINTSKPNSKPIKLCYIKEPFIANTEKSTVLEPGYYSVVFRYRLTGENKINTVTLDSAFIKV